MDDEFRWRRRTMMAGVDNLSDDLVSHILSYLPFRDAVRTSTLSRRWQYLWTHIVSLESLDIDQISSRGLPYSSSIENLPSASEQMRYINGLIHAVDRLPISSIKRISVVLIGHHSNNIVEEQNSFMAQGWLVVGIGRSMSETYFPTVSLLRDLLLRREVEEVNFSGVFPGERVCLSDILRGTKTITSIEAKTCSLESLPSSSSAALWARLRVLKLDRVGLPIMEFQGIIDACTNIQVLHLYPMDKDLFCSLTFKSTTLKELRLKMYNKCVTRYGMVPANLHVDAPNMQVLSFHGALRFGAVYIHGGDGMESSFHLKTSQNPNAPPFSLQPALMGFLHGSANASQLNLGNTFLLFLSRILASETMIKKFPLLTSLSVDMDTEDIQQASALVAILNQCPSLQQLHISGMQKGRYRIPIPDGSRVFSSGLSQATFIRTVKMCNFSGGESNMFDLAAHLLLNGQSLVTFNLSLKDNSSPGDDKGVKELLSLPWSSPNTIFTVFPKQLAESTSLQID